MSANENTTVNANATPKRPVRASAVVRIVIWSLVFCILTGIFVAGLLGVGVRMDFGFGGIPLISLGGFNYEDASTYQVGNATIRETVHDLSINWLAGDVTVLPADGDDITVTEEYSGDDDSLRLRWKVEDGELIIQYCKPVRFGARREVRKNLTVAIPAAMLENMDDVEIDAVSCNVRYTGNANQLNVDTVEGDITVNGKLGELDMDTVDGKTVFRGSVRRADFDGVNTAVTMYLNEASELYFDCVDGDVTLYLADSITGFSAELDSIGNKITADGFDGLDAVSNKGARWGDESLRIKMDGVDMKLEIKKLTNN